MSKFWHKLNDLFDQPAGDQIRWLVGYLMDQQAQAEAEMAGREAEKEGDLRWQEYLSLFMPGAEAQIPPVIADPKTGAQYSRADEYAPATPGGPLAEAYPQAYEILSMLGPEMFGMPGVAGQAFAPPEEELPPESVNMQEMATVIDLMRGDRGYGYPAQEVRALAESAGLDLEREIEAFTQNPEIWTDIFPAAEAPMPEPLQPDRYYYNPETEEYEYLGRPEEAEFDIRGGPSTGGWVFDEQGNLVHQYAPMETEPLDYSTIQGRISGVLGRWADVPYSLGDQDCSAFAWDVQTSLFGSEAVGPRFTTASIRDNPRYELVTSGEREPGDVVVWNSGRGPNRMHMGVVVDEQGNIADQGSDGLDVDPGDRGYPVVGVYRLRTRPTSLEREPLTSAELEDQFWNGLTPAMIVGRINEAGGMAQIDETSGAVFVANPPPQGMDYLYRQYDRELRAAETPTGTVPELGGLTHEQLIEIIETYRPTNIPEMVEIMLYVQAIGSDDPFWWDELTSENKTEVLRLLRERQGQ